MTKFKRQNYESMIARASYYRWSALRGQVLAGNDPLTGRRRDEFPGGRYLWLDPSRVAFIALSKAFLAKAREIREAA
jgi:hypothetical protein